MNLLVNTLLGSRASAPNCLQRTILPVCAQKTQEEKDYLGSMQQDSRASDLKPFIKTTVLQSYAGSLLGRECLANMLQEFRASALRRFHNNTQAMHSTSLGGRSQVNSFAN